MAHARDCRHAPHLGADRLKLLFLKAVTGTGVFAGAVALVLGVQNFTTYSQFVAVASHSAAKPAAHTPQSTVTGIAIDQSHNVAVITMTPFTSEQLASAFGAQYGMGLVSANLAFGRYVFTLPQIHIGSGPQPHMNWTNCGQSARAADACAFREAVPCPLASCGTTTGQHA